MDHSDDFGPRVLAPDIRRRWPHQNRGLVGHRPARTIQKQGRHLDSVVLGVALAILGVPLAGPIAALTFVASFVPVIGAIISGVVAALVALEAVGPGAALIVVVVTVVIHHLEGYVVGPRVIGKRTGLHPVVLILAFVIGILMARVVGGFLAGPIAAAASGWYRPIEAEPCAAG